MVYRSYKDWQQAGYNVIKGEKACARTVNGEALFSEQQVTKHAVQRKTTEIKPRFYNPVFSF